MNIKSALAAACLSTTILLFNWPSFAKDNDGNFTAYGLGTLPCSTFTSQYDNDKGRKQALTYIDGFVSATKFISHPYVDVIAKTNINDVFTAVMTYCYSHEDQSAFTAIRWVTLVLFDDKAR